jgi:hypothetical protein
LVGNCPQIGADATEVFVQTGYAIGEVSKTTTDIELHIVGVQMVAAKKYLVDSFIKSVKSKGPSSEPWDY